ncbi:MAG: rhodanese-like domain-containing protein [Chitinophagaceae bacterium]|nr:rhodanese-like domain-containing protein [Chitinophagaceae bacterium]
MKKSLFFCLACLFGVAVHSQNNYKEISLPDLMQKVQNGGRGYIILDVRTPGEYMDTVAGGKHIGIGRIKNVIHLSLQDLVQKPDAIRQLDKYKQDDVYVICSHSYRSRRISNLLLQNGFTSVNNVKGGMTEWYRNYDALKPYAALMYENHIAYRNMAPAQLFQLLFSKEPVELIGLSRAPVSYFDSLIYDMLNYFPDFKNVSYFSPADSMKVWEKTKAAKGKPVVLFNAVGGGGEEAAEWLVQKGVANVSFLVGSLTGFYEYLVNYRENSDVSKLLSAKSKIQFFTPLSFCKTRLPGQQWVDLRHDTLFNKITNGTKLNYRTIQGAVNFPFYRTADDFVKQFPDKGKLYLFIPHRGYIGLLLAEELVKKGYMIDWLIGGIERWEWYTNNVDDFDCRDYLVN